MATFGTWSLEHPSGETMGTANQDFYLDDQGKVTTDEANAATLLVRKGQDIPKDMADKYGDALSGKKQAKVTADEAATEDIDGGEKASSPSANKKASPSKNKGAK